MTQTAKTLEEELDELDVVSGSQDSAQSQEPVEDAAEPKVEPKNEPAPAAEPDTAAEPAIAPVVTPKPVVTPEPVQQPVQDSGRVEALLEQVNQLSQQILQLQSKVPQPKAAEDPAKDVPVVEAFNYLGDEDIDDVTTDPKKFNAILSKMEARLRATLAEDTTRNTLLSIPDVVQYQIKQQAALDELVREFYDSNQDLKPVKHTVAMVAQNVSSEHPDWTVKQVFEESAKKTREILKLNIPSGIATVTEPLKPAFADHAKAHTKNVVQISELQKQLDEL